MGAVRIGTSGWVYRHWRGGFYPEGVPAKRWFEHYRGQFDTVELNTPFYHLPRPTSVERWHEDTAADFAFAVKGSRFITHNKKLKDPVEPLARFFEVMDGLGAKMAVVLFQLPPSWGLNLERLDAFLAAYRARAGDRRVCFEFRNPQWYAPEVARVLRRWDAGTCIYHLGGHQSPLEVTADFVYVRLHGAGSRYAGAYGERGLASWAKRIAAWRRRHDVFVYFDNDIGGAAPEDALALKQMLGA